MIMSRIETKNFLAPPADAKAALFFLEGNYQLIYREGSVEKTKFLTPSQIGKAFAVKDVFDSGWLEQSVLRFALLAKKTHKILSVLPAGRRKIYISIRVLPVNAKPITKARGMRFSNLKFRFRRCCF